MAAIFGSSSVKRMHAAQPVKARTLTKQGTLIIRAAQLTRAALLEHVRFFPSRPFSLHVQRFRLAPRAVKRTCREPLPILVFGRPLPLLLSD